MKKLLINLWISRVLFVIVCLCNLLLPLYRDKVVNVNAFQFLIIAMWVYGLLSHLGYLKKQVSADEDGVIRYEVSIPIVQIGFIRMVQVGYYLLFKVKVSWVVFVILVAIDAAYIAFILLDKANYYYESRLDDDEN